MRRGWPIVATILGVLLLVGVGVAAYNAGVDTGVRQGAEAGQVVEVVGGHGYYGWHGGFFPFGFLLFPLFIIGIFLLVRFAIGGPGGAAGTAGADPMARGPTKAGHDSRTASTSGTAASTSRGRPRPTRAAGPLRSRAAGSRGSRAPHRRRAERPRADRSAGQPNAGGAILATARVGARRFRSEEP